MTRDQVLDVLDRLAPFKRKGLDRASVPVQFMGSRIAVSLPADKYAPDERLRLEGKFQHAMTVEHGQHAYLDFTENWRGLDTAITGGFS